MRALTIKDEGRSLATIDGIYAAISDDASSFNVGFSAEEVAELAVRHDFGDEELEAVAKVFAYLSKKHHDNVIQTLLRLSRLPQKAPKTFDGFDFARIQGRDAKALKKLPALSNLHARKNIAFIGPEGIGKTHLAQAYGRECCMQGYKTYYLKASELKARLEKAVAENRAESVVNFMVKPSCLIIDEVGRRRMDRECTNLFFDIVDRRYEKEGPNTLILTSNIPANNWDEFFTGDDTLLCALDRMFDRASVFMMKGPSYRGRECDTYSVEAVPTVLKANNG